MVKKTANLRKRFTELFYQLPKQARVYIIGLLGFSPDKDIKELNRGQLERGLRLILDLINKAEEMSKKNPV